ncbi:chaperonin 10-like protein [Xylariales sp. PMI_506]|nr:chaperonin 10-like protein [Xylariales sp. PMI_506]
MGVPETFKAALVPEAGAKHIIGERSLPPLAEGEVAIKITATAINPVDWKIRDYKFFVDKFPAVLGSDAAGEIADVGAAVTDFTVGDRVFFQGIINKYDYSTFQQYCKMPAALVSKTPSNITDEQAAGISLASIAVVTGFYDSTGHGLAPPPWAPGGDQAGNGKAIVVLGGSSSVGQYAIQWARLSGFSRIVTNSSAAHVEHLKSLGAHVVLDRHTQSAVEDYVAAIGDLPLAFVYDSISTVPTVKLGVQVLQATGTQGGQVVTVGRNSDAELDALAQQEPQVTVKPILGLGSSPALRHISEPFAKFIGGEEGAIAKGLFVPNRPVVVPGGLAGLEDALALNKKGVSGEKVVIRPFES